MNNHRLKGAIPSDRDFNTLVSGHKASPTPFLNKHAKPDLGVAAAGRCGDRPLFNLRPLCLISWSPDRRCAWAGATW